MSNTINFSEFKLAPTLKHGVYTIQVLSWKVVEHDKGGYMEWELQFPDRTITQVYFPSNIKYLAGCIRAQLNYKTDEHVLPNEVFDYCIKKDLTVEVGTRTYTTKNGEVKTDLNIDYSPRVIEEEPEFE